MLSLPLLNRTKSQLLSATLQAQLDDVQKQIAAAETSVQTAALAVANGDNAGVYDAARAQLDQLRSEAERLQFAIPAAQRRGAEEAEAARTEEERRRAEVEERARKALFKGAQTDLANWRRAAAAIPAACDTLAVALKNMEQAAGSFAAKIPDNAPMDPAYWRFGTEVFGNLITSELARAAAVQNVELPGSGRVSETSHDQGLKIISDDLAAYAKRVLIDGERDMPRPVIRDDAPPKPYRPAFTETVREKTTFGAAPVMIYDRSLGRLRHPTQVEIAEQARGRVLFHIEHPAEGEPPNADGELAVKRGAPEPTNVPTLPSFDPWNSADARAEMAAASRRIGSLAIGSFRSTQLAHTPDAVAAEPEGVTIPPNGEGVAAAPDAAAAPSNTDHVETE